ncbi:unnamed protein product [Parajaminaea phylloscopi]
MAASRSYDEQRVHAEDHVRPNDSGLEGPAQPATRSERSPPAPRTIVTLADFEVLGTLGTGTFGRVLLVRLRSAPGQTKPRRRTHSRNGDAGEQYHEEPPSTGNFFFALKALDKEQVVKMKQVQHANSERDILARVSHPFVVNLKATFQDSRCIYLLMDFAPGGEIFTYLRRARRFPVEVTKFYIASLVLVLEHLHDRNIVYRDLKPENLLLDADGYIKVTDFGFAKELPEDERTFTLCGTPEFLAPEVVRGVGHGKAADWWALGILMYEMLCGYPPFWDETPLGTYGKILAGKFDFPSYVDAISRDLIRSLLTIDLSRRLGNLARGSGDVKNHFFFHRVDWSALESRTVRAPIVPHVSAPTTRRASNGSSGGSPNGKASHASSNPLLANFAKYPPPEPGSLPGLLGTGHGDDGQVTIEVDGPKGIHDSLFTAF